MKTWQAASVVDRHPHFRAIVVDRQLTGESHLRLHLICPCQGLVTVLCRQGSRSGKTQVPDLFDEGDFQTNLSSGGGLFLQEFHLHRRRTALARHYHAFRHACDLAAIFRKNLEHVEDPAKAVDVFHRALDAFETGQHPEVTSLKGLYLFAKVEGFPVKEDWLHSLPASLREAATTILGRELKQQEHPPETTALLDARLREWLTLHAGFLFPKASTTRL